MGYRNQRRAVFIRRSFPRSNSVGLRGRYLVGKPNPSLGSDEQLASDVLPAAVSDRPGISQLHLSEEGKSSNSLRGMGPAQPVIAVTLDSLLDHFSTPQVLKIDVEGMEYAVLAGARKVLQARPVVFCEVNDHHEAIAQLFRDANYDFYAARSRDRQSLKRPSRDTLALPR